VFLSIAKRWPGDRFHGGACLQFFKKYYNVIGTLKEVEMRHTEISAKGLEYALLKDASGKNLIGIEITCNNESSQQTKKFIEKFPELIYEKDWKVNFWAKGIALRTSTQRAEIALPKKDMSDLKLLFDKARPERKMNLVPIFGQNPGLQLLSE
jgi:hypothetical protein